MTQNTQPTSFIDVAIDKVMDLIDAMENYANIQRGALGIGNGLCCEVAPSNAETVFLNKNAYFPLTLALNGKHSDLGIVSNTLNNIIDTLTRMTSYPVGNGWEIVDISNGTLPRVIGREENNMWIMSADIVVKIYRKDNEHNE